MTPLVLGGVKHCGKTTLGRRLAEDLSCPFVDTDERLEAIFRARFAKPLSCREIFRTCGEAFFREQEAIAVRELAEMSVPAGRVTALGGGVPANLYLKRAEIKALGFFIYLEIPPEIAWKRIAASGSLPPYLQTADPRGAFLAQFRERVAFYRDCADCTVNLSEAETPEAALEILRNTLRQCPGVRL